MVILLAFLAIAVTAAAVPKIAERIGGYVHRFIVANANTNTQMVIRSVNLLLIGLTAVSAVFDLDIVLGAFAAGFILRYLIPEGDQTMEMKHNAIAYGFLVPLFFVASGAKVDVRAIGAEPELLGLFILLLLFVRALPIFVASPRDASRAPWTCASGSPSPSTARRRFPSSWPSPVWLSPPRP